MSNCIRIYGARELILQPAWFDVKRLQQTIKAVPERYEDIPKDDSTKSCTARFIWWFLQSNTHFYKNGSAHIMIGCGMSSHTWRDLKGLFTILSEYILTEDIRQHQLLLSDEYDGHKEKFYQDFELKKT